MGSTHDEAKLNAAYVARVNLRALIAEKRAGSPTFAAAFDAARRARETSSGRRRD